MRTFLISLISLVSIGFSSQSLAAAQCKSNGSCCEELNRMWQEHFSQDFEMLSSSKYKLTDSFKCPSEQSKLAEGLATLKEINVTHNFYNLAAQVMREAGYGITLLELKTRFAEANGAMLAIAFSTVHSNKLSPSTYASYMTHEVEHVKNEAFHIECTHGQNKGTKSCDETLGFDIFSNYGAYTSQFIYLSDVRSSQANDLLKKTSKAMMKTLLENQFNNIPSKGPDGVTPIRQYYDL